MTFVSRLMDANRYDRAIVMLDETMELLQDQPEKTAEVLLKKSLCFFAKQDVDSAVHYITKGVNLHIDHEREKKQSVDEIEFILQRSNKTLEIAQTVFSRSPRPLSEIIGLIDKAAARLAQEERFKSGIKLENIRALIDCYRALLALQPGNKNAIFKLASCYSKFGKIELAIRLFNRLIDDTPLDFSSLSEWAACYREIGNKVCLLFSG